MTTVITIAERHRRKLDAMRAALVSLDALLADYGREHGGRFIRYGSSATGRLRIDSDVDILSDFPDQQGAEPCRVADELCFKLGLVPDCRPAGWISQAFVARALAEGIVLP